MSTSSNIEAIPTDFSDRLRAERQAASMSIDGLAQRSGLSKGYVWKLENNPTAKPSVAVAVRLAAALKISIERLAGLPHDLDKPAKLAMADAVDYCATIYSKACGKHVHLIESQELQDDIARLGRAMINLSKNLELATYKGSKVVAK